VKALPFSVVWTSCQRKSWLERWITTDSIILR
jgi:hypothetical protein